MRVFELGNFVRNVYLQRRFGRLSPLMLLRVEIRGCVAECDWLMRAWCEWDADRPLNERARNASLQAIEDALAIRSLLFCVLPKLDRAVLRAYRGNPGSDFELVVVGTVQKRLRAKPFIRSSVMKARLYGLQFRMSDGALEPLQIEDGQGRSAAEFLSSAEISTSGGNLNGT